MNAKQYLKQVTMFNQDIERAVKKIEQAEDRLGSSPAFDYSSERVQTSSRGDATIVKGINVMQARWELDQARKGRAEIIDNLKRILDTDEYTLVLQMYDIGYSLKSAASSIGWSYSRAKRTYANALDKIDQMITK